MDWGFLDIFKNANFNILMLSAAVTGWILYAFGIYEDISFAVAVFCSLYCIFAFVYFVFNRWQDELNRTQEEQRVLQQRRQEAEENDRRFRILVYTMFNGLTEDNKKLLKLLVSQGKRDKFRSNVKHYETTQDNFNLTFQAQAIAQCQYGLDYFCFIEIDQHPADIVVTIDSTLMEIINEYGDKQNQ